MEGTVSEKIGADAVLQPLAGTSVMVGANNRILFAGLLKEVQLTYEGTRYHISLSGISSTDQLDHNIKNRSFQDTYMTYREVMEQVIAGTLGGRLWFPWRRSTDSKPFIPNRRNRLGVFKQACRQITYHSSVINLFHKGVSAS